MTLHPVSPRATDASHSLPLAALRRIGLDAALLQRALDVAPPSLVDPLLVRVVEVHADRLKVHDGTRVHVALAWPALRARLQVERDALVAGDWAWLSPGAGPGDDQLAPDRPAPDWLVARVPPAHRLTRRDPAGGRQPLVSNVDMALVVMGLDHDFNLGRLDRFLVLAHSAGIDAVVVLSKADGCTAAHADDALARVRAHTGHRLPVLALDGRAPAAREALSDCLATGRTLVLLGSSGAGKSTLTQTLTGHAVDTGPVREGDSRGRHTTTVRTLHTTAGGACVIDTPGLRQLALDVDADGVEEAFGDVAALAMRCRFRDCAHANEPGCAVRDGVPPARLRSYHKLLREARHEGRREADPLAKREQVQRWKVQGREGRLRALEKRGG